MALDSVWSQLPSPTSPRVIYSVITGGYDMGLAQPKLDGYDCILFTDSMTFETDWECVIVTEESAREWRVQNNVDDPCMSGPTHTYQTFKWMIPLRLLQSYETAIFVQGTLAVPDVQLLYAVQADIVTMEHNERRAWETEFRHPRVKQFSLDIQTLLDRIRTSAFSPALKEKIRHCGGLLLFRRATLEFVKDMVTSQRQSTRDQVRFPFFAWRHGLVIDCGMTLGSVRVFPHGRRR
jgi:hypothetical protein